MRGYVPVCSIIYSSTKVDGVPVTWASFCTGANHSVGLINGYLSSTSNTKGTIRIFSLQQSERKDQTICIFFLSKSFSSLTFISLCELTMSELLLSLENKTATEVLSIYKVLVLLRSHSLTMEWCSVNKAPGVQKKKQAMWSELISVHADTMRRQHQANQSRY